MDDVDKASTFFLEGVSLPSLLEAIKSYLVGEDEEVRKIEVDNLTDREELAKTALSFFQSDQFSSSAELRVEVLNRNVVDGGGVRRQFFSEVMAAFKSSAFEGPPNRLRPAFKQSSISSGVLHGLGKAIGQSIVLDTQGFPYLSPPCYWYVAGRMDMALAALDVRDAGDRVGKMVLNVSFFLSCCFVLHYSCTNVQLQTVSTEEELGGMPMDDLMDLMEESGCDKRLKVWWGGCMHGVRVCVQRQRRYFMLILKATGVNSCLGSDFLMMLLTNLWGASIPAIVLHVHASQ